MRTQIVYEGPSELDGSNIIALVSNDGRNSKIGKLDQLWVMPAQHPIEAIRSAQDSAVCGDCVMRNTIGGKARLCYVNAMPLASLWKSYNTGRLISANLDKPSRKNFRATVDGVRVSAYGDPQALPLSLQQTLNAQYRYTIGYTGQWKHQRQHTPWLMASVRSPEERLAAKALGYRTFRVRLKNEPLLPGEIDCPAMHRDITCAQCRLCEGSKDAKDISNIFHGTIAQSHVARGASTMPELIQLAEPRRRPA